MNSLQFWLLYVKLALARTHVLVAVRGGCSMSQAIVFCKATHLCPLSRQPTDYNFMWNTVCLTTSSMWESAVAMCALPQSTDWTLPVCLCWNYEFLQGWWIHRQPVNRTHPSLRHIDEPKQEWNSWVCGSFVFCLGWLEWRMVLSQ